MISALRMALEGKSAPMTLDTPKEGWTLRFSGKGRIEVFGHGQTVGCVQIEACDFGLGVCAKIITGLEGDGDPYAMQLLAATLRGIMDDSGFYIGVHKENPKHDRLVKAYERIMGAHQIYTLMHIEGNK